MYTSAFYPTKNLFGFITTGANSKMFTLKIYQAGYKLTKYGKQSVNQSVHLQNLGIHLDKCIEKAKALLAKMGLELRTSTVTEDKLNTISRNSEASAVKKADAKIMNSKIGSMLTTTATVIAHRTRIINITAFTQAMQHEYRLQTDSGEFVAITYSGKAWSMAKGVKYTFTGKVKYRSSQSNEVGLYYVKNVSRA